MSTVTAPAAKATKPASKSISYDYPYRLRLSHNGRAEIRLERKGRRIVFDPVDRPTPDDIVVLTGPAADRLRGVTEAVRAGVKPTVVAPTSLLELLSKEGRLEGHSTPVELDGVRFVSLGYVPAPSRPSDALRLPLAAGPLSALRAISERVRQPGAEPHVYQLTFPDGARLVHLDLSLHRETTAEWVEQVREQVAGPDWLIVGCPHGEREGVLRWLPRFSPVRTLVAELVNTERKELGLPIELVTPLRDQLVGLGLEVHVFAPLSGYRFE